MPCHRVVGSDGSLVGFACGHVFHLGCLLPKTSASAAVAANLQQQLARDALESGGGRWSRSVGAKVALAILSTLEPGALATALATNDKAAVARAPGVGPKLAQRICAELKDKAPAFSPIDPAVIALSGAVEDRTAPRPVADAISALVNLGYAPVQASAAIAAAMKGAEEGAEAKTLIRLGLRELAR